MPRLSDSTRVRLSTLALVLGGSGLLIYVLLVVPAILRETQSTFDRAILVYLAITLAGVSISMLLYPLRNWRLYNFIATVALAPLLLLARMRRPYLYIFGPVSALITILLLPLGVWALGRTAGIISHHVEKPALYLFLVIFALLFANLGNSIFGFALRFWSREAFEYRSLFRLLRPSLLRVYTYVLMAMTYCVANVEAFSQVSLIPGTLWRDYKTVMLEVLLTYVAIDSVLVAWKDHRESAKREAHLSTAPPARE